MATSMIEYIAVDLDGVFFVNLVSADLAQLAGKVGVHRDRLAYTMTVQAKENGLYDQFRSGEIGSEEYWGWFFHALGVAADAKASFLNTLCSLRHRDLAVESLLDRIRDQGMRTAVLSNNYADNVSLLEGRFGLRERFDALVFSFELGVLKPQPEFYCRAADRIGVLPERVLVIDDSVANIRGAVQAGMDGFLFRGAEDLERELIRRGLLGRTACNKMARSKK